MKFTCQMCGECCTRYTITVTQFDTRRISKLTGLSPTSFLTVMRPHESVANTYFDVPKIILGKNNDNVLSLKERHDACIFRKDNRCSIYPARPLVCRPFPFTYELKRKSDPEFTLNKEARTFCKGIGIGSENFDFSRLKNAVLTMETERERLKKKVQKWNEKVSKGKIDRPSLDALIEFLAPPIKRQSRAE